jgi:hypothetical protein
MTPPSVIGHRHPEHGQHPRHVFTVRSMLVCAPSLLHLIGELLHRDVDFVPLLGRRKVFGEFRQLSTELE